MTYAFVQDVPINRQAYAEIKKGLGDNPPEGLIAHYAIEKEDRTLRYIDLWESEAHWDAFVEARLHPVVGPVLQRYNVHPEREPERVPITIIDTWFGKSAAAVH